MMEALNTPYRGARIFEPPQCGEGPFATESFEVQRFLIEMSIHHPDVLTALTKTGQIISDLDGTVWESTRGIPVDENNEFDATKLTAVERDTIDTMLDLAIDHGVELNFATGKSVRVIIFGRYLHGRMMEKLVNRGMAQRVEKHDEHTGRAWSEYQIKESWREPTTGRIYTSDRQHLISVELSTDNGAKRYDLIDGQVSTISLTKKDLRKMQSKRIKELTRDSIHQVRHGQLPKVYPDAFHPTNPTNSPASELARRGVYVSPDNAKAGFMFDLTACEENKGGWFQAASNGTIYEANHLNMVDVLKHMLPNVNIYSSEAHGKLFIDAVNRRVSKKLAGDRQARKMANLHTRARLEKPNTSTKVGLGDGVSLGSNDESILRDETVIGFTPKAHVPSSGGKDPISVPSHIPNSQHLNQSEFTNIVVNAMYYVRSHPMRRAMYKGRKMQ